MTANGQAEGARSDSSKAVIMRNPLLDAPERPVPSDPDDLSGVVLEDRYRLVRIIAQGAMGNVFLAEHIAMAKPVAVKVLASRWATQEEQRRRFFSEARAAAKVGHEHVVEIHDVGKTPNGSAFMAMELLRGEELADLIAREAPIPWPRAKGIALQVCRALYAAHERGVVHRDLKPENCWRMKRGANRDFIKVLDFGIAKIFGDEEDPHSSLTRAGSIFGTAEYMSPEQARGQLVDARTDVYAMGVLLFELVTGQVPFSGETFMDTLTKQISEPAPPPSAVAPNTAIPPELEAVIGRALAKPLNARFQTMRELAEALAKIPVHRSAPPTSRTLPDVAPDPVRPPSETVRTVPIAVVWILVGVIALLSVTLMLAVMLR